MRLLRTGFVASTGVPRPPPATGPAPPMPSTSLQNRLTRTMSLETDLSPRAHRPYHVEFNPLSHDKQLSSRRFQVACMPLELVQEVSSQQQRSYTSGSDGNKHAWPE